MVLYLAQNRFADFPFKKLRVQSLHLHSYAGRPVDVGTGRMEEAPFLLCQLMGRKNTRVKGQRR